MQKKPFVSIEDVKRKLERYCVYQDRCHKEVTQKLSEYHLIPQVKAEIIGHLITHRFLDEERFAKSFVRGKFRIKKWGKVRIVRELKLKDISNYIITVALQEIEQTAYESVLFETAYKKNELINEENVFKRKKKLLDFLRYKGFETDLIFNVLEEILHQN